MEQEKLDQISRALATGMTRRRAVKLVGLSIIGAAGSMFAARGGSATVTNACPHDCVSNPCGLNPQAVCGSNVTGHCLCAAKIDGSCECFTPICLGPPCGPGKPACLPGFACVNHLCCGLTTCAPLCDTVISTPTAAATRWG